MQNPPGFGVSAAARVSVVLRVVGALGQDSTGDAWLGPASLPVGRVTQRWGFMAPHRMGVSHGCPSIT